MKKCVFAGSFDPPTLGHKKIVEDCLTLFDEVVVAILVNPDKAPMFPLEQREEMLGLTFGKNKRIKVVVSTGTAGDLLEKEGTDFYVRGIRNGTDFAYETSTMYATKRLYPNVKPLYIPCEQEFLHISSSVCRNLIQFNKSLDGYVTEEVKEYIQKLK
jgi:pantetheine-phosphate adenylyltransferase